MEDFFHFNAFRWLRHRNLLKIFIELSQMKDFGEFISSEREPTCQTPQWLRKLCISVNMTRHLNILNLNLRLQGEEVACWFVQSTSKQTPCGQSRWQLGIALTSHPLDIGPKTFKNFEKKSEFADREITL